MTDFKGTIGRTLADSEPHSSNRRTRATMPPMW